MDTMRQRHFTLIELLAVIAIIAILAGIVIASASFAMHKASETKTKSQMRQLEIALQQYKEIFGFFPLQPAVAEITQQFVEGKAGSPRMHGLERPDPDPANWNDPGIPLLPLQNFKFLHSTADPTILILVDAFGKPYYYRCPGFYNQESYDLFSTGVDGRSVYDGKKIPDTISNATTHNPDDLTNWKAD
ncbi:MAG: type II secretion system protein GspG [Lentisphaeria bacterium]|jgi:prepilin-type N-terminal cleavage/methylation domain-containing protein